MFEKNIFEIWKKEREAEEHRRQILRVFKEVLEEMVEEEEEVVRRKLSPQEEKQEEKKDGIIWELLKKTPKPPSLPPKPKRLAVGQIWLTKKPAKAITEPIFNAKPVIITALCRDGKILAVPLNENWLFAGMTDMIVEFENEIFRHYIAPKVMFELWAEMFIPKDALDKFLGMAPINLINGIQTVLSWLDGIEENIEVRRIGWSVEYYGWEEEGEYKPWSPCVIGVYSFKDPATGVYYPIRVGTQIKEKIDSRRIFREIEMKSLKYLEIPPDPNLL